MNKVPGVRTVLVVLSAAGIVFDIEAIRQKIVLSYPDAAVFFQTTGGGLVGPSVPHRVDLLIDLTGPRQRQPFFFPRRLRRMARFAVGRNAGFFRKRIYDRIFDEKTRRRDFMGNILEYERTVQREVLVAAGVLMGPVSETPPDRSASVPLELPPLKKS